MADVTGPFIAITSVLASVFIPTAILGGLQGEFYRQIALTVAIPTILSAVNTLTLSPALAAILLKRHVAPRARLQRASNKGYGWLCRPFYRAFHRGPPATLAVVPRSLRPSAGR